LSVTRPDCGSGRTMILMAQTVPGATRLPCIATMPIGWRFLGGDFHTGRATFWLGESASGGRALTVSLAAPCAVARAQPIPSDEPGMRRFEESISMRPAYRDIRSYVFPGGCATFTFALPGRLARPFVFGADTALSFVPRGLLVARVARDHGL